MEEMTVHEPTEMERLALEREQTLRQREAALEFYGSTPRFFMTGDCEKVANLQVGNRSAMGKVAQL